jgi:hypothetical protein
MFKVQGLDPAPFRHLFGQSDIALRAQGVTRCVADANPGFPDRIEVRDARPGESLLLLNYLHQPAATPYRASHAIYIVEGATQAYVGLNEVPEALLRRMISLRGFDNDGMLRDAELASGTDISAAIEALFGDSTIAYLQAHYAKMGCFAARIERAYGAGV